MTTSWLFHRPFSWDLFQSAFLRNIASGLCHYSILEVDSYNVSKLLPRRTITNPVVAKRKIVTMTNGDEMRKQI